MRSRGFAFGIFVLLVALEGNALAQAAAEAVLTHSISTSAGASLGKAMGNALGSATGQVATRLGQQTASAGSRQRLTTIKPGGSGTTTVVTGSGPEGAKTGSLIASIQGAAPTVTNCVPATKPAVSNTAPAKAASTVPSSTNACAAQPVPSSSAHPAVVNLPAAK
jgi:hypothetical protein